MASQPGQLGRPRSGPQQLCLRLLHCPATLLPCYRGRGLSSCACAASKAVAHSHSTDRRVSACSQAQQLCLRRLKAVADACSPSEGAEETYLCLRREMMKEGFGLAGGAAAPASGEEAGHAAGPGLHTELVTDGGASQRSEGVGASTGRSSVRLRPPRGRSATVS